MPHSGAQVWQFCEFRFDYILDLSQADAQVAAAAVFQEMAVFERIFCKALEMKFRDVYHLTVLNLRSKQYALVDGEPQTNAKRLFQAAQDNDVQTIEKLAKDVENIDWRPKECAYPMDLLEEEFGLLWVGLSRTPLLGAAEEGHVEAMKALLDAKADVNLQDNAGFHALYLGAGAENAEKVVKFLLAAGAQVNLKNKSGYTPIHNACGCGEAGAIKALLEAKADLNIKSNTGAAPVHVAVINNAPASLETLAERKANLDMPAFGGNTPVHEAVMQNNPDMIQKLLDLKADVNIESGPENGFSTPLKMAMDRKKKKAAKKLQALGALEKIEGHEYEDFSEGEAEPGVGGGYMPRVTGRVYK
jgi:aerobic-type carbon monoxide dehydrogenase small subunit (CoxS/CutS family)